MIPNFDARFNAAYDLRCYHLSKGGYVDSSTDSWEYLCWEPQDPSDVMDDVPGEYTADDESDEF